MPKAGFWAIGGYAISFRRDGRWYADDEPIANPRIARLFSEHVRADGKGGWMIDVGIDRQSVSIEDTALVVTSIEGDCGGHSCSYAFRLGPNGDVTGGVKNLVDFDVTHQFWPRVAHDGSGDAGRQQDDEAAREADDERDRGVHDVATARR